MRVACLPFVVVLSALVACGEVSAPAIDATVDTPMAIDAVDAPTDAALTLTKTGTGGTVTSLPAGIDCGATCQARFALGSSVTLTATLDAGVAVVAWGGACASATGNTCTVTITADTAASVEFGPSTHTITITTGGNGTGGVVSTPAGINCGNGNTTCTATFPYGTSLTLTPTATAGSLFGGWSGGTCSGITPCLFIVRNDATANADFQLDNFTLIVAKAGNGGGTVSSTPTGIACGTTCAAAYPFGQTVTLTATAEANSTFNGWTGACTGTGTCVVSMTQSRMVTASFTLQQFTLSVTKAGAGTGTVTSNPSGIACGSTCSAPFDAGTLVTLTATAAAGSTFAGWSGGGCTGTGACTVTINAAASVTATFNLQQFTLSVTKAGAGTGTVTSTPTGISCGATCSANYSSGTVVTLTASAPSGSTFAGWGGGGCTGTGNCVVTMNAAVGVTATFNSTTITITVARSGPNQGTITSSPAGINCGATCTGTFTAGTVVTLTQAVNGSVFGGWSGPCSGVGNCTFTVGAAATVTATYRSMRVAIESPAGACHRLAGNTIPRVTTLLQARGNTVTVVAGTDIDTAAEISQFDVVVIGSRYSCTTTPDLTTFDPVVDTYVRVNGGGLVAQGWGLYENNMTPGINAALPSDQVSNYLSGPQTCTTVAGSPITVGVTGFTTQEWLPWGGGPRTGATPLLTCGTTTVAESWTYGVGRSVFAGPMYLEDYGSYNNESLTDGTQPASIEFFMRAIEWAGKAR